MKRIRHWKKLLIAITILLGLLSIVALSRIDYGCDWTGFGRCLTVKQSSDEIRPEKTLWDWMNLLIVPVVLATGGIIYSRTEKQNEQRRTDDNLQEAVLSSYLDRISSLLLNSNLRKAKRGLPVRDIAHGWTVMVLPRLNGSRKGVVLQFLHGSNLLNKKDSIIELGDGDLTGMILSGYLEDIYLNGADMENADLSGCYLWGADLSATYLKGANLENANLGEVNFKNAWLEKANIRTFSISGNFTGARLMGADLTGTNLSGVDLSGADLKGAKVTTEQLLQAISLKDAIMPDGSKHN